MTANSKFTAVPATRKTPFRITLDNLQARTLERHEKLALVGNQIESERDPKRLKRLAHKAVELAFSIMGDMLNVTYMKHGKAILFMAGKHQVLRDQAEQRNTSARVEHSRWQALANEFWKRNPKASKLSVAGTIVKQLGLEEKSVRNVRRKIKRPSKK